ncbi:hypothetical protein [Thermomonospora amylolytica]|uniref:hypothetical protein n=1 Tax=Thermomonospora amylolytica TaxID=1411117 RepID=UPI00130037B3|nr:hypothetical protein [Thermomonospora amylolytica]
MIRFAVVAGVVLGAGLMAPGASAQEIQDVHVKESKGRVAAVGPGFTLKLTRHGITTNVVDEEFGDPATGNEIVRQVIDLAGRTFRPFVCENGTYTIKSGTFERTWRFSLLERRPAPYPERFHAGFPGFVTPFLGEFDATVTDETGETLRVLISDLAYEARTENGGFRGTYPIHGFVVDQKGKIRDRISLFGRFRSGPGGANATYWIEDRGTCHQTADLGWGEPNTDRVVVTGPLLVLPFNSPVITPGR